MTNKKLGKVCFLNFLIWKTAEHLSVRPVGSEPIQDSQQPSMREFRMYYELGPSKGSQYFLC